MSSLVEKLCIQTLFYADNGNVIKYSVLVTQ